MAYQKKVTKGVFDAVKILIAGGARVGEVCKYLKISDTTFYLVRDSETYEEYQQKIVEKKAKMDAARAAKADAARKQAAEQPAQRPVAQPGNEPVVVQQPQVIEHRQTVTVQATHYMMEELKKQNELLTAISNKLAYIVEQLA